MPPAACSLQFGWDSAWAGVFACNRLYTTLTLTKRIEKKLDENYTRILRAVLNKSWKQHPRKQPLYGHLPLI